jgi:hypothetical protein
VSRDVGREHHDIMLAGNDPVANGDGAAKGALAAGEAVAALLHS